MSLHEFYASNLRASLFSGFLTLTGFLFTAKTFIIINMKKEVYDHASYKKRIEEKRVNSPHLKAYGPLQNLSTLLFCSVLASLSTAVLQLTVGLVTADWASIACIAAAGITVAILIIDLLLIRSNLKELFLFQEAETKAPNIDSAK